MGENELIELEIDGRPVKVLPGQTILQTLKTYNISIPHLCHDTRLSKANGNCGLCVVELVGKDRYVKACETPILAGMKIETSNKKLKNYRRVRLEQILSDHNADCVAPCITTCPANIDIQAYLRQIADGNFAAALRLIKDKNPLPVTCGRVCPHPCEAQCRRKLVDQPLAINNLKRFVSDMDLTSEQAYLPQKRPATGKKIVIVGAGPAGLSCAYYSAINGHEVTIFEQQPEAGGMLRYGIPEYRLPKATLDREIDIIKQLGVTINCTKKLGTHIRLEDLNEIYDAVFLAVGSWKANSMKVPGETASGVWLGIDFLETFARTGTINMGEKVIVIGGGNTAVDCARTAIRQGANVQLVYRRTREEMPAEQHEIADALLEGIELIELAAPVKVVTDDYGKVKAAEFIKMQLGEVDRSGRRRVIPIDGSEYIIAADTVISAIGQSTDTSYLWHDLPVQLARWGDILIDGKTMQTSETKIFAGGDCVTGPATVIQAVAAGRTAADCINDYVNTGIVPKRTGDYSCSRGTLEDLPRHEFEVIPRLNREQMPTIALVDRVKSFQEVELGYTTEQAIAEAKRCLRCGCSERYDCDLRDTASDHSLHYEPRLHELRYIPPADDHPFIVRDHNKCIACGRCIAICQEVGGPGVLDFYMKEGKLRVGTRSGAELKDTNCVDCGQCVATCPCGALDSRRGTHKVFRAINDPDTVVVGFMAPAVRTVIAQQQNLPYLEASKYTVGMLKALGFDKVFDVNFTADLTTVEETNEFIERVQSGGVLPQFTSCCPAWVTYIEKKYPEFIPNLSSCRSPQQMLGALMKNHFPEWADIDRKKIFSVSVMPCIAKKSEAARAEFVSDGVRDIDAVITTKELLQMLKLAKVDEQITPVDFDKPYNQASGAACLFGVTGGVAESALRTAADKLTGKSLEKLDYQDVRGLEGIKESVVDINGLKIKIGVVNSLKNAEPILEAMRRGAETGYHLIEVMACPGGCIDGAGQPMPDSSRDLTERKQIIMDSDKDMQLRKSQDNEDIIDLYTTYFGAPNSELAHKLLHTKYRERKSVECLAERENSAYRTIKLQVCVDKHCAAKGSNKLLQELKEIVKQRQLEHYITVKSQLCKGHCQEPGVFVSVDGKRIAVQKLDDKQAFIMELLQSVRKEGQEVD